MLAKGALSFLSSPAFASHRQGWTRGRPTKLPCFGGQHLEQAGNGEIAQQRWNQGLGSHRLMLLMASHTFNSIYRYQSEIDLINFLKIWSRKISRESSELAVALSLLLHRELNQQTQFLLLARQKEPGSTAASPRRQTRAAVINVDNITRRLEKGRWDILFLPQHTSEELSKKLKGGKFKAIKKEYFYCD